MMRYFNHSCAPNMISVPSNGHLMFITARPIKKGDQLLDSTKSQTRDCCSAVNHSAICMCKLCSKGIAEQLPSPEQRHRMKSDPNFKCIMAIGDPSMWNAYDDGKVRATIIKCVQFLKEYHVKWCDEIEVVMKVYQELVRILFRKSVQWAIFFFNSIWSHFKIIFHQKMFVVKNQ